MFLIPGTAHIVRWTKQNLLDETTYYPLAIIRDTRTDTILDQFALDSLGSGRFSKSWNVVQDPVGFGREIEVEITIYEDSDHTQVSAAYGRWTETYTVYDLPGMATGGLGGSVFVDYKRIGQMFDKKIDDALTKIPQPKEVDLSAFAVDLGGVKQSLGERIKEIFRIGRKVDRIEEVEKNILEVSREIRSVAEEAKKTILVAVKEASQSIAAVTSQELAVVAKIISEWERNLISKSDEDLAYTVSQFKKIMEKEGATIAEEISKAAEALRKPVRVAFMDLETEKEDKKEEKKSDGRVDRFLRN